MTQLLRPPTTDLRRYWTLRVFSFWRSFAPMKTPPTICVSISWKFVGGINISWSCFSVFVFLFYKPYWPLVGNMFHFLGLPEQIQAVLTRNQQNSTCVFLQAVRKLKVQICSPKKFEHAVMLYPFGPCKGRPYWGRVVCFIRVQFQGYWYFQKVLTSKENVLKTS